MKRKKKNLSPTRESVRAEIEAQNSEMGALVEKSDFSARDVFIAREIVTNRVDSLRKLERMEYGFQSGVEVEISGTRVSFDSIDDFAEFAVGVMYERK